MADQTASVGFRDILAAYAATLYYFVTLHGASGSTLAVASDTYSAGIKGELATGNGYTQGAKTLALTNTGGVLDGPDAVWTASGGNIGPASYCAVWVNTTNSITGAKLLCVDDRSATPQTASDGNTMTGGIANTITIPTPA